jgi:hypothetical protein
MFLLCLIAALSGTPLRQAEAASDFVRALGVLCDAGDILAEPDGGVGDDQHETITEAGVGYQLASVAGLSLDFWTAIDCPPPPILTLSRLDPTASAPWQERVPWPPLGAARRQAWLQLYLF